MSAGHTPDAPLEPAATASSPPSAVSASTGPSHVTASWGVTLVALSAIGLLLATYLSLGAWLRSVEPIGCGAESGCGTVLGSAWSRVAGVPVSVPAGLTYAFVLALGIACWRTQQVSGALVRGGLAFAAAALVAGAAWFITLQAVVLEAWCAYCLVSHAVGLLLAGAIVAFVFTTKASGLFAATLFAAMGGVLAVGVLAGVQWVSEPPLHRIAAFELELRLAEEPRVGSMDAERHIVVMLDYACPVCRDTHAILKEAVDGLEPAVALIMLPVPLNPGCNPHAPAYPGARFEESCELARIALAVHRADGHAYAGFESWLFDDQPRPVAMALEAAAEFVGKTALEQAINDSWIERTISRNTIAYGQSEADRLPVIVVGDASPIVGHIDSPQRIRELLDE